MSPQSYFTGVAFPFRPLLNPTMPPQTDQGKEWESAVADSPVRHAILNRPFTLLRKRTESLLDSITGGTLPPAIHEAERRQKETDRQLKCRGCKVLFGDEKGLIRHHDLFPAHVNPPDYKRKPRRRRSRRSQSTSDVLTTTSAPRAITRHSRAETMINPHTADAPLPIESMPVFVEAGAMRRSRPSRPLPQTPSQEIMPGEPTSLSAFTTTEEAANALPSAPLLPAFDFGAFKLISQETGRGPSLARPVTKSIENTAAEEKNRAAGAASASKMVARQEEKRTLMRGASESALDTLSVPITLHNAARAIIATGKMGALEPASMGNALSPKSQAMYAALSGEEEIKAEASSTSTSVNWSSLKAPLVATPEKKEQLKAKMVSPVTTGLTSFSRQEDASPSSKPASPTNTFPRLLTRKSTNPFLNEAFMNSLPNTKTPPLSPSTSSFSRQASSYNPFARLSDGPYTFDNADDFEEHFYDAPKTPSGLKSNTNPFFKQDSSSNDDVVSYLPRSESAPILTTRATLAAAKPRGVHFDKETALQSSDNPRCPSCYRRFVDLESVLSHVDGSDCDPFRLNEGQAIHAN